MTRWVCSRLATPKASRSPQRRLVAFFAGRLVVFFAGERLAVFFAGDRRAAEAFFAGARRTGAAATLPAAFTAASSVGYAPFLSLGAPAGAMTASLKAFTGVILAFFDALIRICSPVAGLRPHRAGLSTLTNLAKPVMATGSPLETTAVTTSVKPSRTEVTVLRSVSVWTATAFASSRLFMGGHSIHTYGSLRCMGALRPAQSRVADRSLLRTSPRAPPLRPERG